MGIRGGQGSVRYGWGVGMAPTHGILTKKMFVPPLWLVGKEQ